MKASNTIVPVLIAGGTGTRLWPLSRESHPKQFLRLFGNQTLLQHTALRAAAVPDSTTPIVVCSDQHRFIVAEQLREVGIEEATIILEPTGRNTAPAAAVAALHARKIYGDNIRLFVMAADHYVANQVSFIAAAQKAAEVAAQGMIVIFGVTPTRPETGYGYIRRGAPLDNDGGAFAVAEFAEKPSTQKATEYIQDVRFLWNAGLFLFTAKQFLDELARLKPAMLSAVQAAFCGAARDLDFLRLPPSFSAVESDSIDYAVMEKTPHAAVVPMDCGWDDVGSWTFLAQLAADSAGNVTQGDVLLEDCGNTLVHAESRLVTACGVQNSIIIETQDAVMVIDRDRAQDVKNIVSTLRKAKRSEATQHARVLRPWGSYETLSLGVRFQVKYITVKPGEKLSLQMHHHRAEHWIVVSGTAVVTVGDKTTLLAENQSTYIPLGTTHRLENPGKVLLELIEVQSGSYLGEDDIVRFDDVYGRASASPPPKQNNALGGNDEPA